MTKINRFADITREANSPDDLSDFYRESLSKAIRGQTGTPPDSVWVIMRPESTEIDMLYTNKQVADEEAKEIKKKVGHPNAVTVMTLREAIDYIKHEIEDFYASHGDASY